MKRILLFAATVFISGIFNVSCETVADSGGISGSGGNTRESLYQEQDRAFRQLAY